MDELRLRVGWPVEGLPANGLALARRQRQARAAGPKAMEPTSASVVGLGTTGLAARRRSGTAAQRRVLDDEGDKRSMGCLASAGRALGDGTGGQAGSVAAAGCRTGGRLRAQSSRGRGRDGCGRSVGRLARRRAARRYSWIRALGRSALEGQRGRRGELVERPGWRCACGSRHGLAVASLAVVGWRDSSGLEEQARGGVCVQ